MKWADLSWVEKAEAIDKVFGADGSDSHGDALLYLWGHIYDRGLADAYIAALADILGFQPPYTPTQIVRMMLANDPDQHWPAALRAAGMWEPYT